MTRAGKARRHRSAAEKLKILEEARQPQTTVAEVLRRHQLDATTFYRWEREAKAGRNIAYKILVPLVDCIYWFTVLINRRIN